jgi:hypothetical protein
MISHTKQEMVTEQLAKHTEVQLLHDLSTQLLLSAPQEPKEWNSAPAYYCTGCQPSPSALDGDNRRMHVSHLSFWQ